MPTNEDSITMTASDEELRAALADANLPTLLMVLRQMTGDDRWAAPPFVPTRTLAMNDNDDAGLSQQVGNEARAAALDVLRAWRDNATALPAPPSTDQVLDLLTVSLGEEVPEEYATAMAQEGGFQPRKVGWTNGEPPAAAAAFSVIIVGAGVSGLAAAVTLKRLGIPFVVIERHADVGGVWLENDYPGAGVDTPSHLYSFSFAPNRSWTRYYAKQPEIIAYLRSCAEDFGVRDAIRFETEVVAAHYNEESANWSVRLQHARADESFDGDEPTENGNAGEVLTANAVIMCVGQLNRPSVPHIPGLDTFPGPAFHSARWDHDVDVAGKRVAIIGTGASAMQIAPSIADAAERVLIFQRSPQWAIPNVNYLRDVSPGTRLLMQQVPYYASFYRMRLMWQFSDKLHPTLQRDPAWPHPDRSINAQNEKHRVFLTKYLDAQIAGDDQLRPKVLPQYPPYGKRPLMDNNWFRTVRRGDVDLITSGVTAVDGTAITTQDGQRFDVDVIVLATGFQTHRLLWPIEVRGRSGITLREVWGEDDAWAYLGIAVPEFPNLFMLFGPNTALGHGGSAIFNSELQANYVAALMVRMIEDGVSALEVRRERSEEYKVRVDQAHEHMIWTHPGMTNWYRNKAGRVVNNTPWRGVDYWRMTQRPCPDDYEALNAQTDLRNPVTPRSGDSPPGPPGGAFVAVDPVRTRERRASD